MNRFITIFLLTLLFCSNIFAQQGNWHWARGTTGNSTTSWPTATDSFGNVYAAGVFADGAVSFDDYSYPFVCTGSMCILSKYDITGNFLWARSTQNGVHTSLTGIAVDHNGNCFLLGWLTDSVMEMSGLVLRNTVYPHAQYYLVKFDAFGAVLWAKIGGGRSVSSPALPIGLNGGNTALILGTGGVAVDVYNHVYVTTCFNLPRVAIGADTLVNTDTTGATDDFLLAEYDPSGNLVRATSSGGKGIDIPTGITVTPAGDVYIAGVYNSDTLAFGASIITDTNSHTSLWNGFLARYDPTGHPVWATGISGSGHAYAAGLATDGSSRVYVTGGCSDDTLYLGGTTIANPYPGKPFLYLQQFTASNNVGWNKAISSRSGGSTFGYGITAYISNICVVGAFSDSINIDGHTLDTPIKSTDPVFIAGFDTSGYSLSGAALPSGSSPSGRHIS